MKKELQERALRLGFDLCRISPATPPDHGQQLTQWLAQGWHGQMEYLARNAFKRIDPQQVLPAAQSIVVLAANYHYTSSAPTASAPLFAGQVACYARFRDYHDVLAEQLKALVQHLDQAGGPQSRSLWYVDTGPLLERSLAQRAGVGFVGKHTNLISRQLGNWFFLGEIITTIPLEPDAPEHNRCGSCNRCLNACPTGAITAPFQLDARRCISYLTIELKGSIPVELRRAIGNRVYGCDDCLAACPWNRFARESRLMRIHRRPDLDAADLLELLSLDETGFKNRFAGTPMLRVKRHGLLRNVCVVLGNVGDERALPALERAAADAHPLIVEHARWAIEEITSRLPRGSRLSKFV